jgi:hypothetical protein
MATAEDSIRRLRQLASSGRVVVSATEMTRLWLKCVENIDDVSEALELLMFLMFQFGSKFDCS